MAEETAEADRIESDLAQTRARMDRRLDQLQDHLSPRQMLNDAFGYFRGGDGADFTRDLVARVKANPMPVALVGVGVAWMMAGGYGDSSNVSRDEEDLEARVRRAESELVRHADETDDAYHGRLDDARGQVLGIARDTSDTVTSYAQRVKDTFSSAMARSSRASHDAADRASDRAHSISKGTQVMARLTRDALSSIAHNPFALGGVAALVGLVAGSLLPTSEEEEHLLGSAASKVRTAGKDLAQDVVDRGGRIANDAVEAVKASAEAHGLTGDKSIGDVVDGIRTGDLIGDVKEVAQETLQAGKDSAQDHVGDTPAEPERQPA